MSSAFSTTVELDRAIEVEEAEVSLDQIFNEQHKETCLNWIKQNNYKKVCLQFPDHYLIHSSHIYQCLKNGLIKEPEIKLFILADTSYGSCCVDEIAAAHVDGDSVIHFGNACRSKVWRLPVLYMFPTLSCSISTLCQQLESNIKEQSSNTNLIIYLDIGYHQLLQNSSESNDLRNKLQEILCCKSIHIEVYPAAAEDNKRVESDNEICLFIGADNVRFFQLSLTTKALRWFIYNPAEEKVQEKNPLTANYVRRRYYYIEKCKDAQTLGLIVATLSTNGYLDVVARLQEMAKAQGIKTQIISVGRINPAKLANFMEIDCFVLIGCPFNNMYNSKDYYKPIVSVFEAEMALNPAWLMHYPETYVTDFTQLLPEGRSFLPFDHSKIVQNDISLISGRMRGNNDGENSVESANNSALNEQQRSLVEQPRMELMTTNTGLTFEDRTWKGLNPALGCNEPSKLQKGLSGIPIKYSHD